MYAGIGSLIGLRLVDLIKEKVTPVALFVRDQTRVVFLHTRMEGPKKAAAYEAVDRFLQVWKTFMIDIKPRHTRRPTLHVLY